MKLLDLLPASMNPGHVTCPRRAVTDGGERMRSERKTEIERERELRTAWSFGKAISAEIQGVLPECGIGPAVAGCLLGGHNMLYLCCLHVFT